MALALIATGQLFALSLRFSASAVAPQLRGVWDLSSGRRPVSPSPSRSAS